MAHATSHGGMERVLEHCTAADLLLLAGTAQQLQYRAGDTVVAEGTRITGLYLVRQGRIRLVCSDPARPRVLAGTLEPDDVFGAGALLENGRAPVALVAATDVEVDRIDGDALNALLAQRPEVGVRVYRSIAAAVARRIDRMIARLGPPTSWDRAAAPSTPR